GTADRGFGSIDGPGTSREAAAQSRPFARPSDREWHEAQHFPGRAGAVSRFVAADCQPTPAGLEVQGLDPRRPRQRDDCQRARSRTPCTRIPVDGAPEWSFRAGGPAQASSAVLSPAAPNGSVQMDTALDGSLESGYKSCDGRIAGGLCRNLRVRRSLAHAAGVVER